MIGKHTRRAGVEHSPVLNVAGVQKAQGFYPLDFIVCCLCLPRFFPPSPPQAVCRLEAPREGDASNRKDVGNLSQAVPGIPPLSLPTIQGRLAVHPSVGTPFGDTAEPGRMNPCVNVSLYIPAPSSQGGGGALWTRLPPLLSILYLSQGCVRCTSTSSCSEIHLPPFSLPESLPPSSFLSFVIII